MINNHPIINVYKKKSTNSGLTTQLLYGEKFNKINKSGSWIYIKNCIDNYKGFIKNYNFPKTIKNTHKVGCLSANTYSKPNLKSKLKKRLTFGSRVQISKKKGIFYKTPNFWIRKKDLKKINILNKDPFSGIKKFINVKYKWGGKNFSGIDCSALVQVFLNYNNKFCPRDTFDQIKFFKKKVKLSNIKKNDLIFWKGHVAIAISKKTLIHAYGPRKKVVIMPINKTIKLIERTAKLKVKGVRRI